jgi:hypothetical protein
VDDRQACAKLFSILLPTEACEMEFGKSEFVRGGSLLGLILLAGLGDTSLAQQTAPPLPANVPALPAAEPIAAAAVGTASKNTDGNKSVN